MSNRFRRDLARRLLQIAAVAAPVGIAGCSSDDSCGKPLGEPFQVCIAPLESDAGTVGPDGAVSQSECPTGNDETLAILMAVAAENRPTLARFEIQEGPTLAAGLCCYQVQPFKDCTGRPFLLGGQPVTAPARTDRGWIDAGALRPGLDGLDAEARAALAAAWTRDGLFEHASVASFGRLALELLAAGAPADLVEDAHRAALDEIRHARLCFGLAAGYSGVPVGPGTFPFGGPVEVSNDRVSIAVRAAREGCIGETIAAVQAAEQLARAVDPVVREVLAVIAEDEARHAELAWRVAAWAVLTGGPAVRAAVAVELRVEDAPSPALPRAGRFDRHGRLDADEQDRLAARTLAEVVAPAARLFGDGLA